MNLHISHLSLGITASPTSEVNPDEVELQACVGGVGGRYVDIWKLFVPSIDFCSTTVIGNFYIRAVKGDSCSVSCFDLRLIQIALAR